LPDRLPFFGFPAFDFLAGLCGVGELAWMSFRLVLAWSRLLGGGSFSMA
jgi:hypothetical protein